MRDCRMQFVIAVLLLNLLQAVFSIKDKDAEITGFFSTEHQTIFTHHSNFLHMHLITDDLLQMGHVDELKIDSKKIMLFLPAD